MISASGPLMDLLSMKKVTTVAASKKYATVLWEAFNKVSLEILNNAWEGYHFGLLDYGRNGSNKSYSMMDYLPNKGIVPLSCEEIF